MISLSGEMKEMNETKLKESVENFNNKENLKDVLDYINNRLSIISE